MGEPEGTEITSTQQSLSSSHDPGWNDPPKWAFTPPQTSCTTPTKRLLNKRVAFPLNSAQTISNPQSQLPISHPPNLPPPVSSKGIPNTVSGTTPSDTNLEDLGSMSIKDKEDSLNEALANLEAAIGKHVESKTKVQEVQKRIEIMKTLWLDDKLDDCIHKKVLELSNALKEEDVEKADKIHIYLMMERGTLCSSWIPGIRHLILEMRCKLTKSNDEKDSDSGSSLIPTLSLESS